MSKNGLLMDDAELVVSFRRAKNQSEQIGVLADLNCTSPMKIAERLDYLGELDGTGLSPQMFSNHYYPVQAANGPPPRRRGRPLTFDPDKARELYAAGKTDSEIAYECATTTKAIKCWRYSVGLIRPKGGNMMKKSMSTAAKAAADAAAAAAAEPEEKKAPEGLSLARLSELLGALAQDQGANMRVLVAGMPVRGLTVKARYDGTRADGPAELCAELETW